MILSRPHQYSLEAIEAMLLRRIETLARELAPDGMRRGQEWVARNPCRADHSLGSFSINTQTGRWSDFAADDRSSRAWPCLSLVAYLATGGRWKSEPNGRAGAIRWARDWLGLTDMRASPTERARLDAESERAMRVHQDEEKRRAEHKRLAAHQMWLAATPLDGTDPASLYLMARGIDVTKIPGGIPGCLRWTSYCRRYTGENQFAEHTAMLAAMHREGAPGGFAAVHRTYLAQEPSGRWWKAFGGESKTILGAKAGASIRLTRGPSGRPLSEALDGEWIGVAEGIENALSAAVDPSVQAQALSDVVAEPGLRIIAAGTLENIAKLVLPDAIAGVFIIADNDKPSPDPKKAGPRELVERFADDLAERCDIETKIVRAPEGFKDFNAVVMGERQ